MTLLSRALVVLALVSCGDATEPSGPAPASGPLVVWTVSDPLAYFAERIGGEQTEVTFPAPADVDPADWSPAPDVVAGYQEADLILLNGAGYASWVARASLPRAALVDTSASFRARLLPRRQGIEHAHGPGGAHSHGAMAYTTWLDPNLAIQQARAVADAFARARPAQQAVFRERMAGLEADLRALDRRLEAVTSAVGHMPILFSHPVYDYLERRYGLNGRSLHWERGVPPDEAGWRALSALLEEHPARLLVWEAPAAPETLLRLATLEIRSTVFEPAGNRPRAGDFLSVMHENAQRLEAALR